MRPIRGLLSHGGAETADEEIVVQLVRVGRSSARSVSCIAGC